VRRSRGDTWNDVAAAATGALAGFGLYLIVSGLGFGGGRAGTENDSGDSDRGTTAAPLQRDLVPLTFVMTAPVAGDTSDTAVFRLGTVFLSLDEMIARILAGSRSDVVIKIRGDVRTGSAVGVMTHLKESGIEVIEQAS